MQVFRSDALARLKRAFGITGQGSQQTILEDSRVDQVLEISQVARRSRTPFGLEGLFHGVMQNSHAVAGELQSFIDPYAPLHPQNGFPDAISPDFDIWLLGASIYAQTALGGNVTFGALTYDTRAVQQMFSVDAAGAALATANREQPLMVRIGFTADATPGAYPIAPGEAWQPFRIRCIRGGSALSLRSEVTAAAAVVCIMNFGLFPAGLGQDGVG
jgi:hypothetical protein